MAGRPKEFDPEEALDKAMRLFWSKGYHETSIRDLIEATGVNYYGLYGAFESKQGLFLAALDRYRATVTAEVIKDLPAARPVLPAIRKAFARLLQIMDPAEGRRGCLMCNAAVELGPHEPEAAAKVQAHLNLLGKAFRAALARARDIGEIAEDVDIGAQAEFLATTAYSAGVLLRAGLPRRQVQRHVDSALAGLG